MLTVYRSNRAEWLAKVLSEQLRLTPPGPFETTEVIVNTWPTSRWLGEELATSNGISALTRFPFPGTRLKQLVKLVLGLEDDYQDPWDARQLVWQIINTLPELLTKEEADPLKEWFNQHPSKSGVLNIDKWQLSKSIADAFDDYALYRVQEITDWLKPLAESSQKLRGISKNKEWQPILIRLLAKSIDKEPFGLQAQRAIRQLKNGTPPVKKLPKQLNFFGISSLAPIQIELIQALSGVIDINFFLITPCRDLWQRCAKRRESLGQAWIDPLNGDWLIKSPRLEAHLGRMGAEFQQLLEGSGESQLGEWREGDLFAAPVNIANTLNKNPTLLEQLQQQLVDLDNQVVLKRDKEDTSIQFVASPGQWRQVQLVRDQILQWFANDASLEPKDILIMTPQVERYAPLISSVFNVVAATSVEVPFRITDRSQQNSPGIAQYMLQLLKLANSRLDASSLDSLLTNPAIQKQQGLNQDDVNTISEQLQLSGFRWGLDAEERGGDEIHSLTWCLDRWLLGIALPQTPGLAPGGAAPFSQKITFNELTRWWNFLSIFCNQLRELRRPRTCEQWTKLLRSFAQELFDDGGLWASELKNFLSSLEDWKLTTNECQLKIEATVVAEILKQLLCREAGRFGHRTGLITISALEPMRAIPHRAIVLMGLDSDIYPHHKDYPSFHLLAQNRRLGDPKSSDQDRYVLLEAIMSSRQHLLITWNSRNERTGEHVPPASPVQQWLGQLENELDIDSWDGLLRSPHPNPLSDTNFLASSHNAPISCDKRNLDARLWLNKKFETKPIGLALPLRWDMNKVKDADTLSYELFRSWLLAPQNVWLDQLHLQHKEWLAPLESREELALNELKRYQLLKERFEHLIHQLPDPKNSCLLNQDQHNWEELYAGQGVFPPTNAAFIEYELLSKRWAQLQSTINKIGPLGKDLYIDNGTNEEILWAGEFVVVIELGKLKAKKTMEAWLKHLQICAAEKNSTGTIVIARSTSKSKQNQFEVALRWSPLLKSQAENELKKLKALASKGLEDCWPVPPESGWSYAKASREGLGKGEKAFKQKWDGFFNQRGEREASEMQICYGSNLEAKDFMENAEFHQACSSLYDLLLKSLI